MKKLVLNDDNLWSGKTKTDRQTDLKPCPRRLKRVKGH